MNKNQKAQEPGKEAQPSMGAAEALFQGVKTGFETLGNALGKVWDELAPAFNHGRSEVAAALFNGSPYVMYQHGGKEQQFELEQGVQAKQENDLDQGLGM